MMKKLLFAEAVGILLMAVACYLLVRKVERYTKQNENFADLLERIKTSKSDPFLGIMALWCPYFNMFVAFVVFGLVFSDTMWESFVEYLFSNY